MPDGEGIFDGDGSVRWSVLVEEDDDRKGETKPEGDKGRRSTGVDKQCKTYFRVVFKVPTDPAQRQAFLDQFASHVVSGDEVEVRLPIAKVSRQIKVKWNGDGPVAKAGVRSV